MAGPSRLTAGGQPALGQPASVQGRIQDFQKGEARSGREAPASSQMWQAANSERREQQWGSGGAAPRKFRAKLCAKPLIIMNFI